MTRRALAITHVACEDLGSLGTGLLHLGFAIDVIDAAVTDLHGIDPLLPDLLVVLGGPISVYESDAYPFIDDEIALLRSRLTAKRPTIGICLGAQLVAKALGSNVYPGTQGKEIGWAPVQAGADASLYPAFAELLAPNLHVLHWHGDTFDLPASCCHLAGTSAYPHQAFAVDRHGLALQFHPEVTAAGMERWLVSHACELSRHHISVPCLRAQSLRFAPVLAAAAQRFWRNWLLDVFGYTVGGATASSSRLGIDGRFWLENQGSMLAGRGRIELLERVHSTGSIREAAKAMKMGYKAAWDAMDAINRKACQPVVTRTKGGRMGGGSQLTPHGQTLISAYRRMETEHDTFLEQLLGRYEVELTGLVADESGNS